MKKIDWYILKKFLVTFVFCMLLFMVVAVAVDTSEKADDFVKTGLSTYEIIMQYYLGFVPFIWGLLFPLFVFISVIFFTSRMASRSEIIAILASGAIPVPNRPGRPQEGNQHRRCQRPGSQGDAGKPPSPLPAYG